VNITGTAFALSFGRTSDLKDILVRTIISNRHPTDTLFISYCIMLYVLMYGQLVLWFVKQGCHL